MRFLWRQNNDNTSPHYKVKSIRKALFSFLSGEEKSREKTKKVVKVNKSVDTNHDGENTNVSFKKIKGIQIINLK